jgi:uncharacterized membrane protein YphA (DoxX/SURF4 family)
MPYAALASRFVLATVFILAGLSKISAPSSFARAVRKYDLLPERLETPVAYALPPIEVGCGLLLALGIGTSAVAVVLAAALVAFTIVVGIALTQRKVIDCGCFGPTAPKKITWFSIFRNALLLAVAILVMVVPSPALSIAPIVVGRASAFTQLPPGAGTPVLIAATTGTLGILLASEAFRARKAARAFTRGSGQT